MFLYNLKVKIVYKKKYRKLVLDNNISQQINQKKYNLLKYIIILCLIVYYQRNIIFLIN